MNTLKFALFSVLLVPALLAGCSIIDPAEDGGDNRQGTELSGDVLILKEGEQTPLPSQDATLTFVEKTEDSRCPRNVTCIWEGEATIVLAFARSGQTPTTFEMIGFVGPDGVKDGDPASVAHEAFGLRFSLLALTPYPEEGVEQTDPVTATIRVEAL